MVKTKSVAIAAVVILIVAVASFAFISANSHTTKINMISNGTYKNGDNVEFMLTDDYRNVYSGETIDIKILDDSGWANNYDVVTDNYGEASVVLSAYQNGNYTIHTNYNGTLFNKPYHGVNSLVIDDGYDY